MSGHHLRVWSRISCLALVVTAAAFLLTGAASAAARRGSARAADRSGLVGSIAPSRAGSDVDCNGWSPAYPAGRPAMRAACKDPVAISAGGKTSRFLDNGWYVGHDEPGVGFISSRPGSGNSMTYYIQLPVDPTARPTGSGSVVDYGELSVAPWVGLVLCDPDSYPQNPCKPDSDSNSGSFTDPNAAGSAYLELQFYPPGFTPWIDAESCSTTRWCSALNIDSLECTFGFATCNANCEEPFNFAFLQRDGVPTGPAAPQDPTVSTYTPNAQTLMMNSGDVLEVTISDPPGGLITTIDDLSTGQTGYMQASAANGFANTNIADCSGNPFTWHAEYSSAKPQNQLPWAPDEPGVEMVQEIGHFESCDSLANNDPFSTTYEDGSSYSDPATFDTCDGGLEGPGAIGEGPCNPLGMDCVNSTTQGADGPTACPTTDSTGGALCEFADGFCFRAGRRVALIDGQPVLESSRVNGCFADRYQNGDLDFDGNPYQANEWPGAGKNLPTPMRTVGPFSRGRPYPDVQFATTIGGSSSLCDPSTGSGCTVPPISANFYPFWSLSDAGRVDRADPSGDICVWNFGNDIPGVTVNDLGRDAQYGPPDVKGYTGFNISAVENNPALMRHCGAGGHGRGI